MTNSRTITKLSFIGIAICALSTLFYAYDFVIRILPGTIYHDLMYTYHLSAANFGLLSSFFFIGYVIMQLPCGLLYDRFGVRIVSSVTLLMAAIATYFLLATHSFYIASTARFFMGLGSAFAYIGALVLASRWLPAKYYALVAGLIQLIGALGAIFGETPIAKLVDKFGAETVVNSVALFGILLAIIFIVFIRNQPGHKNKPKRKNFSLLTPLKNTLKKPQNWFTACCGFFIWAPITVFASLWAVPFFKNILHISVSEAAFIASFLWLGVAMGGPCFGLLSSAMQSRRKPLLIASVIGLFSSATLIFSANMSVILAIFLSFFIGFASSAQAITFGLVNDNNPIKNMGTASAFNNMAIVFGGVIFQPMVGLLLQLHQGTGPHPLHQYSHQAFGLALSILPLCYFFSLLINLFFIKETLCKNTSHNFDTFEGKLVV